MGENPERKGMRNRDKAQKTSVPSDPLSEKSAELHPSAKAQKRETRRAAREQLEFDWLAPAGSESERQYMTSLLKHGDLSREDRENIFKWMNSPNGFSKRNILFWKAAKKSAIGSVAHARAMERHGKLDDAQWLVAYFTTNGLKQNQIAQRIHLGERAVDNIIQNLKEMIRQEFACEFDSVELAQIARWFLGL